VDCARLREIRWCSYSRGARPDTTVDAHGTMTIRLHFASPPHSSPCAIALHLGWESAFIRMGRDVLCAPPTEFTESSDSGVQDKRRERGDCAIVISVRSIPHSANGSVPAATFSLSLPPRVFHERKPAALPNRSPFKPTCIQTISGAHNSAARSRMYPLPR
jgi:hypothetical protein